MKNWRGQIVADAQNEQDNDVVLEGEKKKSKVAAEQDQCCDDCCEEEAFIFQKQEDGSSKKKNLNKLIIVTAIGFVFMLMQLIGGLAANSVALISDSFHMLTDISAMFISMISIILGSKRASKLYTYGYHRAEAIGALVGVFMIWGLIVWMIIESIQRMLNPPEVEGKLMLIFSGIGLFFNLVMMNVLGHDHAHHGHSHGHDHGDHNHEADDHQHGEDPDHGGHNHDHHDHDHDHEHHRHDHHHHGSSEEEKQQQLKIDQKSHVHSQLHNHKKKDKMGKYLVNSQNQRDDKHDHNHKQHDHEHEDHNHNKHGQKGQDIHDNHNHAHDHDHDHDHGHLSVEQKHEHKNGGSEPEHAGKEKKAHDHYHSHGSSDHEHSHADGDKHCHHQHSHEENQVNESLNKNPHKLPKSLISKSPGKDFERENESSSSRGSDQKKKHLSLENKTKLSPITMKIQGIDEEKQDGEQIQKGGDVFEDPNYDPQKCCQFFDEPNHLHDEIKISNQQPMNLASSSQQDSVENKPTQNQEIQIPVANHIHVQKIEPSKQIQEKPKQKKDLNIHAAFIHVLGDTLQSLAVVFSACLIFWGGEGYKLADPICTIIFSIITVISTNGVFKDSIFILMEKSPNNEKYFDDIMKEMKNIDGVKDVHDLHIWSISSQKVMLSAHVTSIDPSESLKEATQVCKKFGIYHSTLQIENFMDKSIYNSEKCSQLQC